MVEDPAFVFGNHSAQFARNKQPQMAIGLCQMNCWSRVPPSTRTLITQDASSSESKFPRLSSGAGRIAALTAAVIMLSSFVILAPKRARADNPVKATYVGVEVCAGCHQTQAERWKMSHHALAMEKATPVVQITMTLTQT